MDDRRTGAARLSRHQARFIRCPHAMERKGYLESRTERAGRSHRRIYRATAFGVEAPAIAQGKIRELFREVVSADDGR